MKKHFFILILSVFLFTDSFSQSINFQKYPSGPLANNKAIKINRSSDKNALLQLDYALNDRGEIRHNKINFASNYEIITYGVGAGCQQGVMVDLRDGKVYGLPIGCPACDDGTEEYFDFKNNSLLFVNTYCDFDKGKSTKKYVWSEKNKKFYLIK
jgi:hypothetical protein